MYYNKIIIFMSIIGSCVSMGVVPVFVIDYGRTIKDYNISRSPFHKINAYQFLNILTNVMTKVKINIIFIEDTLSQEDLSIRDKQGTPFKNLRQGLRENNIKYMPYVQEPYHVLTELLLPHTYNSFELSKPNNNNKPYLFSVGRHKYIYVYFKDYMNETRITALRRHDAIIKEVYLFVRQLVSAPVVAFYTGKWNPITNKPKKKYIKPSLTVPSKLALFHFKGVSNSAPFKRESLMSAKIGNEYRTKKLQQSNLEFMDFQLQFNFSFNPNEWILDSIGLMESGIKVGEVAMNVRVPWGKSYVCALPLRIRNTRDNTWVSISQYQIQPYGLLHHGEDGTLKPFDDAVNCEGVISIALLTCFMITSICVSVFFLAINFLMNVKSNDKFDDFRGKPVFFGADGGRGETH